MTMGAIENRARFAVDELLRTKDICRFAVLVASHRYGFDWMRDRYIKELCERLEGSGMIVKDGLDELRS